MKISIAWNSKTNFLKLQELHVIIISTILVRMEGNLKYICAITGCQKEKNVHGSLWCSFSFLRKFCDLESDKWTSNHGWAYLHIHRDPSVAENSFKGQVTQLSSARNIIDQSPEGHIFCQRHLKINCRTNKVSEDRLNKWQMLFTSATLAPFDKQRRLFFRGLRLGFQMNHVLRNNSFSLI